MSPSTSPRPQNNCDTLTHHPCLRNGSSHHSLLHLHLAGCLNHSDRCHSRLFFCDFIFSNIWYWPDSIFDIFIIPQKGGGSHFALIAHDTTELFIFGFHDSRLFFPSFDFRLGTDETSLYEDLKTRVYSTPSDFPWRWQQGHGVR